MNYTIGKEYFDSKQYVKAIEYLQNATGYQNAYALYQESCYVQAQNLMAAGKANGSNAYNYLNLAGTYKDSAELKKQAAYQYASYLETSYRGQKDYYDDIINWFNKAGNYNDAKARAKEIDLIQKANDKEFLIGRWTGGDYYLEFYRKNNGVSTKFNLPYKEDNGQKYSIVNSIYRSLDKDGNVLSEFFKFTLTNDNTLKVYCYSNGHTYTLRRK